MLSKGRKCGYFFFTLVGYFTPNLSSLSRFKILETHVRFTHMRELALASLVSIFKWALWSSFRLVVL